jgi:putative colanic acid biosynthesis glycosyltransferase WcaI
MKDRVDVDPLRAEVELLRTEADRLGAEVDPLRVAHLLIVAVDYTPQDSAVARFSTVMARDLATIAERVAVFTGLADEPRRLRLPGSNRRTISHDRGVQLVRHRHHAPTRAGGLGRARYERSFLRAVLGTQVRSTPDVVIGVLPSIGAAVAAARVAYRFRAPLMLVVQDLVATRTRDGGLIGKALARGQAEALRQAARVVLVDADLRPAVAALGVAPHRIQVLADRIPVLPEEQVPAAARLRLGVPVDGLVVVHIGNIGTGQDVPTLVRAARRIADQDAVQVRFVLVGEGSQRETLETATADLPAVRFRDPVTASEYPLLLAAADVLVVTERSGHPDRTLPSRLQSYLRAGRPIVAAVNADGDADRLLQSVGGAAVTVPAGDDAMLAAVLIRLRNDGRERIRLADCARDYADAVIRGGKPSDGLRAMVRTVLSGVP